jgi:hypothetical protein
MCSTSALCSPVSPSDQTLKVSWRTRISPNNSPSVVLIGKPIVVFFITWLLRYPVVTSLAVAGALAQIGEFSFMLSRVGRDLVLLTADANNALVAVAILSNRSESHPLPGGQASRPVDTGASCASSDPGSIAPDGRRRARRPHADTAHRAIDHERERVRSELVSGRSL